MRSSGRCLTMFYMCRLIKTMKKLEKLCFGVKKAFFFNNSGPIEPSRKFYIFIHASQLVLILFFFFSSSGRSNYFFRAGSSEKNLILQTSTTRVIQSL